MKYTFLIVICFLLAVPSNAQEPVWTLEFCIDKAISNSILVKRSQLNRDNAKAYFGQSKAQLLPSLSASANHSYNFGRNINPVTNTFEESNIQGNQFSLNGSLPIFSGLQTQFKIKETQVTYMATKEEIKQSKNDITLKVISAYLEVLFNQELLKAAQWQLENSTAKTNHLAKSLDAGISSKSQLLEAQSLQVADELGVTTAESNVELSTLALLQLMLLPPETPIELSMPEAEPGADDSYTRPEDIYASAVTFMPAPKRADLLVKSAKFKEYGARSARLPRLMLIGSVFSNYAQVLGKDNPFNFEQQMKNNFGQYVRLALDIPLFNAWQARTGIQAAVVNRKNAEINAFEIQSNLRQDIEKAYLNKKTAYKKHMAAQNQSEVLRETFRMAEQKLDAGTMNLVEFGTVKNNLFKAESEYIRAKYDYIFKTKILDFYQTK